MRYTSIDFGKTPRTITPDVPERLVHRGVERTSHDDKFSQERKHRVFVVDLPTHVLSMTIGGLDPGQTTSKHRHNYETVIYVMEGEGFTVIEGRRVDWSVGDAVYIPAWAWHQHTNASATHACRYVACENAPMLQELGIAVREEEDVGP
jgi:gentisate 1,2-dioxygenase